MIRVHAAVERSINIAVEEISNNNIEVKKYKGI